MLAYNQKLQGKFCIYSYGASETPVLCEGRI
jgi:hypothetical protein